MALALGGLQEEALGRPGGRMSAGFRSPASLQCGASRLYLGTLPRKLSCCCRPDQVSESLNNRQQWGKGQDWDRNRNYQTTRTVPVPGACLSVPSLNLIRVLHAF